jgi:hypothetical protein
VAATFGVGAGCAKRAGGACRAFRGGQIGAGGSFATGVRGDRTGADSRKRLPAVMATRRPHPAGPGAGPGIPAVQDDEGDQQQDEDADG